MKEVNLQSLSVAASDEIKHLLEGKFNTFHFNKILKQDI